MDELKVTDKRKLAKEREPNPVPGGWTTDLHMSSNIVIRVWFRTAEERAAVITRIKNLIRDEKVEDVEILDFPSHKSSGRLHVNFALVEYFTPLVQVYTDANDE